MQCKWILFAVVLIGTLPAPPGGTLAQGLSEVPLNGQAKPYGRGWECKRGFRQDERTCIPITLPENAYLSDSSDPGWRCRYGYKQNGNLCAMVRVPPNAYF